MRIPHRSLCTRTWKDPQALCRLCGEGQDSLSHLAECPYVATIFTESFKNYEITPNLVYLGLKRDNALLKVYGTVSHNLIW